ncbi:hypothetical protein ALC60_07235 [Trachymyrmex zeteki]|uniref:Uncharacterized protein n=1 Tax=Mycetomoellerius zeteki TaxID=64791 RepID=A0A151X0J7_9HYME|nr:hypothetical protein ALC60_07235 [Trachymyrmex zeteki]
MVQGVIAVGQRGRLKKKHNFYCCYRLLVEGWSSETIMIWRLIDLNWY